MFILNESEYTTTATKGSRYTGDLQGAMYAVLDNNKNWNRICEAASLMELQYYNEHGANVWAMDEAAMPGFLKAILDFLKKVKDKIVEMFKQFVALISSFVSKDKDFTRKYSKEIMKRAAYLNSTNYIEIDGYKFTGIDNLSAIDGTVNTTEYFNTILKTVAAGKCDSDFMDDLKKNARADLCKGKFGNSLDSDELKDKVKEFYYGSDDKEGLEINDSSIISKYITYINDTSKNTKDAESVKKESLKNVDKFIKDVEKLANGFDKMNIDLKGKDDAESKDLTNNASAYRYAAELARSASNDITIIYGVLLDAIRDRNRQARAVCVKCLGLKQESASYYGSGSLLGNVTIL